MEGAPGTGARGSSAAGKRNGSSEHLRAAKRRQVPLATARRRSEGQQPPSPLPPPWLRAPRFPHPDGFLPSKAPPPPPFLSAARPELSQFYGAKKGVQRERAQKQASAQGSPGLSSPFLGWRWGSQRALEEKAAGPSDEQEGGQGGPKRRELRGSEVGSGVQREGRSSPRRLGLFLALPVKSARGECCPSPLKPCHFTGPRKRVFPGMAFALQNETLPRSVLPPPTLLILHRALGICFIPQLLGRSPPPCVSLCNGLDFWSSPSSSIVLILFFYKLPGVIAESSRAPKLKY